MNDKRHKSKSKAPEMTVEQVAAQKALREANEAAQKAERERLHAYGKEVKTMSDKQLLGALGRVLKAEGRRDPETHKQGYHAGLTVIFATVLSTVLKNTKTPSNPWGKLNAYPR